MADVMKMFVTIVMIQLFFGFGITVLSYALPDDTLDYVNSFSDLAGDIDLASVSDEVRDSVDDQLDIPVIELGALVFYSGNILIDLLLNFLFAIPEMIGLLINGFLLLFNVDNAIFAIVELFSGAVITILYLIGIIQLVMNARSGGKIL